VLRGGGGKHDQGEAADSATAQALAVEDGVVMLILSCPDRPMQARRAAAPDSRLNRIGDAFLHDPATGCIMRGKEDDLA